MQPSTFPDAVLIDPSFLEYDHRGENLQAVVRLARSGFPVALWSTKDNDWGSGLKVIHPESTPYQLRSELGVEYSANVLYLHISNTTKDLKDAAKSAGAEPFNHLNTLGLHITLEDIRRLAPQHATRHVVLM